MLTIPAKARSAEFIGFALLAILTEAWLSGRYRTRGATLDTSPRAA